MACSTPRPRPSQNGSRSLNLDFGQLSPAGFTLEVSDYSFSDVESSEPGERSHTVNFTSNATDSPHFGHGSAEVNQVLLNRSMFSETGASTGLDPCGMDSPQKPESPVYSSSRSPTYKLCYDSPPTFQTGLDSDAPIFQIASLPFTGNSPSASTAYRTPRACSRSESTDSFSCRFYFEIKRLRCRVIRAWRTLTCMFKRYRLVTFRASLCASKSSPLE